MFEFFLKGIFLGFAIAAPVGPIGILCIRKTLQYGRASGFCAGLGAAIADMLFGSIAAFGLTVLADFLVTHEHVIRTIGGFFMIYLGWRTYTAKPHEDRRSYRHTGLWKDFMETFFLTLTNPMTILAYLVVFAGLGLANVKHDLRLSSTLVIGVLIGSALWWLILSQGVALLRKKIEEKAMRWINRTAGFLIAAFGIWAMSSTWFPSL